MTYYISYTESQFHQNQGRFTRVMCLGNTLLDDFFDHISKTTRPCGEA